nr:MIF4G domain-containing protein-like [Dermacentor andersoni]
MSTAPSLVAENVQQEQTSGPKDEEMSHKCHMPSEELFEAAPVSPLPSSRDDQEAAAASGPAFPEAVAWSKRQPGTLRYIVAKGTLDPTGLTGTLWAALARALCKSVIEGEENALAVATPCVFFSERDKSGVFSRALLNSVHKWFNRRGELLEASSGYPRRWTTYVSLVTMLFLELRRKSGGAYDVMFLATLLCNCCLVILCHPLLGNDNEMECLRWVLTAAGSAMQATVPWLMTMLTGRMRSAFMQSGVSAKARYTLLELIELRASGWQLNAAQVQYYRPQAKPGPPGTRS